MKYRIKYQYGRYIPQFRCLFMWMSWDLGRGGYLNFLKEQGARDYIKHNRQQTARIISIEGTDDEPITPTRRN